MNIVCVSILAGIIILSDEIINGKLQVSKRLFNWIEKVGDRSPNEKNTTADSE